MDKSGGVQLSNLFHGRTRDEMIAEARISRNISLKYSVKYFQFDEILKTLKMAKFHETPRNFVS